MGTDAVAVKIVDLVRVREIIAPDRAVVILSSGASLFARSLVAVLLVSVVALLGAGSAFVSETRPDPDVGLDLDPNVGLPAPPSLPRRSRP